MDLASLVAFVKHRRSVRKFLPDPIPREILDQLVDAAQWAPSAGNRQDWQFTIVTDRETLTRMAAAVAARWSELISEQQLGAVAEGMQEYAGNFNWFNQAPAVIAVAAKVPESFLQHVLGPDAERVGGTAMSAALASQNLMLAADAAGLGTCCLTGPVAANASLKEILAIGARRSLICLIALGYPAETPRAPKRKPLDKITRYID